jgi:hypothetical protein
MKRTPLYRRFVTDPQTGARSRTSWRMCADDPIARYPGAEPDLVSIEWRNLPDSVDEWDSAGKPPACRSSCRRLTARVCARHHEEPEGRGFRGLR